MSCKMQNKIIWGKELEDNDGTDKIRYFEKQYSQIIPLDVLFWKVFIQLTHATPKMQLCNSINNITNDRVE